MEETTAELQFIGRGNRVGDLLPILSSPTSPITANYSILEDPLNPLLLGKHWRLLEEE